MSGWATIRDSVGKTINLGRQTKANSVPVTMASDQDAIPVTLATAPLATNAAQETGGNLASILTSIQTVAGSITGAAMKVVLQTGANVIGAVTQSGTWTVQPGNTANTTAWKVDGSAVTQPVSGTFWQSTQPVQGVAGMTPVTAVGIITNPASGSFTRPNDTTAYASGDLVANSTTAGSVAPMQVTGARVAAGNFMLRRVRLRKSSTGTTNASFRVHCYGATISTITNGDNGAWNTSGVADYLGSFDVTMDKVFTDGASGNGVPGIGNEVGAALASGQIVYCLLEARGSYAPVAQETFTLIFEDYVN